jgi:hypothetical protein
VVRPEQGGRQSDAPQHAQMPPNANTAGVVGLGPQWPAPLPPPRLSPPRPPQQDALTRRSGERHAGFAVPRSESPRPLGNASLSGLVRPAANARLSGAALVASEEQTRLRMFGLQHVSFSRRSLPPPQNLLQPGQYPTHFCPCCLGCDRFANAQTRSKPCQHN